DGFRMDTMKHVDDAFWQRFAPEIEAYAQRRGIDDFYMFGEVAEDFSHELISHYPVHDDVQGVLDFLFQMSARDFASKSLPTNALGTFFQDDDWYTDGDSNVYNLPTFLGNHDRGRIGMFVRDDNAGAPESELLARDRLAHELMYFSRGNPVVYYGDEQGFTGAGGDQDARQDMFPSQSKQYDNLSNPEPDPDRKIGGDDGAGRNDNIGSDETPMDDNFDTEHPLYRKIRQLAKLTQRHRALRDGAQQHRFSSSSPGVYAFSRISGSRKHEYVVALNNAEQAASASIPTFVAHSKWEKVYGDGPQRLRTGRRDTTLDVALAPLSTVVYRAKKHIPRSKAAPMLTVDAQQPYRDRLEVVANVQGSSFYDVTIFARVGNGKWHDIGTDDNAPYRVFHDVSDIEPSTPVQYRAVVLDNANHTRASGIDTATVAPPSIVLEAPNEGQRVRGEVEVRALATPDHADYEVTFQRSVNGGAFEDRFTDDSSPVYTLFDDTASLPDGAQVTYRAVLDYGSGEVVSDTRTVTVVQSRVTTAVIHYKRTDDNYTPWGLHLFNAGSPGAMADGEATPGWELATAFEGTDAYGVYHSIDIANDTGRIGFIVHGREQSGGNKDIKDPAGSPDRFFVPLATPEIWLRQGDVRIFSCAAADDTCVVPSA
ncbi:MAG TPA: alpha-amylase family glycosyl hydrolase, partial [Ilumatobacter sp.]